MSKTYTLEQQVSYIQEFEKSGLTMAQFAREKELSYPQFYGWVKKYEKDGLNALVDRRGIRKEEGELSREEILERKLARLEKQLEEEKKLTKV